LINTIIKNTLRLPRPDSFYDKDHGHSNEHEPGNDFNKIKNSVTWKNYLTIHRHFGMPSGHAQAVVSEFTFIALYFQKPLLTLAAFAQVLLTIYQRYATRRHSIKQLIAGSAIGIFIGLIFYKLFTVYII
jgi:membrane-associated phospholipid phosphatase